MRRGLRRAQKVTFGTPGRDRAGLSPVLGLTDHAPMSGGDHDETLQAARAALDRGDAIAAIGLVRARLRHEPRAPGALALLANAAIRAGRHDEAIDALHDLARADPSSKAVRTTLPALLNHRGTRLRRDGDEDGARRAFEAALALDPAQSQAGFNLALCLRALGRDAEALSRLQAHLARHADDAEARVLEIQWRMPDDMDRAAVELDAMVGDGSYLRADPADWALACARVGHDLRAIAALPRVAPARSVAAALDAMDAMRGRGDMDAAARAAHFAWSASGEGRRSPGLKARLARLALPSMMTSLRGIAEDRERLRRTLGELDVEWTPSFLANCEPRLEQLAWSNFYLAYHGEHDLDLQRAHARLIERAARTFFPQFGERPATGGSRRVGLLSSSWRDCTAGVYFGGWIDWLRDAGYEVHLYQLGPHRDRVTEALAARADVFRFHRGPLHELAASIRGEALDLLIYPELGMDSRLLPLAALRLAARQVVAWGHPVTTGLSTIDGFLTCGEMEPQDATSHYAEPLLPLPGLGVAYTRPPRPARAERGTLGLPGSVPLALVPQSLFKLHPDDDALLAAFAASSPTARIVLFEGSNPVWRTRFERRLAPAFAARGLDHVQHLHWMRPGSRERYLQINSACDLMLDSLRWSGGNTSLDALACGLPVVTCPGGFLRARQSAAMLATIGLSRELVCTSPDALVQRATALAGDEPSRRALSGRILAAQEALHAHDAARRRFVAHVAQTIATRVPD